MRTWVQPWETFEVVNNNDGTIAFKTAFNRFVRGEGTGGIANQQTYVGPWERWVLEP